VKWLCNRYAATGVAVVTGLLLAMFDVFQADSIAQGLRTGGKGAITLWPLFGATNQLLAGLALLVATVWLYRKRKPVWLTALPMVFMLAMTGAGLVMQVRQFLGSGNRLLFAVGLVILALEAWMVVEAAGFVLRLRRVHHAGGELPEMAESA